jgi:hypothetical protein
LKDKADRELVPGDLVVYGSLLGRGAGLRYGVVLTVTEDRVAVRGWDDATYFSREQLTTKQGTLRFPSRVLAIPDECVPYQVRHALRIAFAEYRLGQ